MAGGDPLRVQMAPATMQNPLKVVLGLLLLAIPLVEIALLIKASSMFGFWAVLLEVMVTAFAGASIIRTHGLAVFSRVFAHIEEGRSGLEPLADTFLAVAGGILLIFPGLISDLIGALLQIGPVRSFLIRGVWPRLETAVSPLRPASDHASRASREARQPGRDGKKPVIIDGEYKRIDEAPTNTAETPKRARS